MFAHIQIFVKKVKSKINQKVTFKSETEIAMKISHFIQFQSFLLGLKLIELNNIALTASIYEEQCRF